jgi:hypothetical protein
VQEALLGEYHDLAGALSSLDQSYSYSGMSGCVSRRCGVRSWTAGSSYGVHPVPEPPCFGLCTPSPRPLCRPCIETPCRDCLEKPCDACSDGSLQPIPDNGVHVPMPVNPCLDCPSPTGASHFEEGPVLPPLASPPLPGGNTAVNRDGALESTPLPQRPARPLPHIR